MDYNEDTSHRLLEAWLWTTTDNNSAKMQYMRGEVIKMVDLVCEMIHVADFQEEIGNRSRVRNLNDLLEVRRDLVQRLRRIKKEMWEM